MNCDPIYFGTDHQSSCNLFVYLTNVPKNVDMPSMICLGVSLFSWLISHNFFINLNSKMIARNCFVWNFSKFNPICKWLGAATYRNQKSEYYVICTAIPNLTWFPITWFLIKKFIFWLKNISIIVVLLNTVGSRRGWRSIQNFFHPIRNRPIWINTST